MIKAIIQAFAACNRSPRLVVALTVLASVLLGALIPRLRLDLRFDERFAASSAELETYRHLVARFGPEPALLVVAETSGRSVFEQSALARIADLSNALAQVPGIARVVSIGRLPGFAPPPEQLARLPLVRKLLVSADQRAAALLLEPRFDQLTPKAGEAIVDQVARLASRFSAAEVRFFAAGPLVLEQAAIHYARRDLAILVAVATAAIALILWLAFRSYAAVVGPLLVAAATTAMTLGILAALGVGLSQFSLIAIPVMVALSVLDCVHIVHAFLEPAEEHPAERMRLAIEKDLVPCFWTSFTEFIGFVVLVNAPMAQMRSIGLVVALGMPISYLLSFTFLPCLLSLVVRSGQERPPADPFHALAPLLTRFIARHARAIVAAGIAVGLFLGIGSYRLKMALDFPHIFRPDLEIAAQHRRADEELGGSSSMEVLLRTDRKDGFRDPEMIARMARFSVALNLAANVSQTISALDVGASAVMVARGRGDAVSLEELQRPEKSAKMLAELERSGLLRPWVSPDFREARIHVKLRSDRPELHGQLLLALDNLGRSFAPWFTTTATGFAFLYKGMERLLLESFFSNFGYTLLAVSFALFLIARRWRLGLAAVLVNLLPTLAVLGLLGWLGLGISAATVILPAIGLGLITDDTIHFLIAMRRAPGEGEEQVAAALGSCGWPTILTQLILLAAFGALVLSSFSANVTLGWLMALTLVIGLAFDLLVMPALVLLGATR